MNQKLQRFYSRLFKFSKDDYLKNPDHIAPFFKFACEYDFEIAVSLWEYLILEHESQCAQSPQLASIFGHTIFKVFLNRSELKTMRVIHSSAPVRKVLYTLSPLACEDLTKNLLIGLLLSNKVDTCDEILKCLYKNAHVQFGPALREVVESYISQLMAKAAAQYKRIDLPRKNSALLSAHIAKIRGPERPLLEQRLREIY